MLSRPRRVVLSFVFGAALWNCQLAAAAEPGLPFKTESFCAAWERFIARNPDYANAVTRGDCPLDGACDDPVQRDAAVPSASAPWTTIPITFHVFCRSDGTGCWATPAEVDQQIATLNADFAPHRIRFVHRTRFIAQGLYRRLQGGEEFGMKSEHADAPASRLNVYLVETGGASWGTFPWDPDAAGVQGGIVLDTQHFGPGRNILTHEVGHCLGLWHTHHGVSELPECSECYEAVDTADRDLTGDRCSDTNPTPVNISCGDPTGVDACSALPWGETDFRNYMGYAPDSCYTGFSPQQSGRMHCWTNDRLSGWIAPPCAGDANYDGLVNVDDLGLLLSQFNTAGTGLLPDFNDDGAVNTNDLGILLANFNVSCR